MKDESGIRVNLVSQSERAHMDNQFTDGDHLGLDNFESSSSCAPGNTRVICMSGYNNPLTTRAMLWMAWAFALTGVVAVEYMRNHGPVYTPGCTTNTSDCKTIDEVAGGACANAYRQTCASYAFISYFLYAAAAVLLVPTIGLIREYFSFTSSNIRTFFTIPPAAPKATKDTEMGFSSIPGGPQHK